VSRAKNERARTFMTDRMRAIDAAVTARVHARIQTGRAQKLGIAHARLMADLGLGARPTELARRLGVTKAAVGQLVNVLETQGLVERAGDPSDRRAQIVRPTPRAERLFQIGREELNRIEAEWRNVLGATRLKQLAVSLELLDEWRGGGSG
jgi:DNA-binding MarR family transcriptional regulator